MPNKKRTGLRKPKNYLKAWNSDDWTKQLTPRLHVAMVDEELPVGKEGGRKSWYLHLNQAPDLREMVGPVHGAPTTGISMLLFEDDVVALVEHLFAAYLVDINDGRIVNGVALEHEPPPRRKGKSKKRAKRRPS